MTLRDLLRAAGAALACAMSLGIASTGSGIAAEDLPREQRDDFAVRVENGRVSAAFVDTPLVEAVAELAREVGFELVVEGKIDRRVNLTRSEMEISELLGELLLGCSWFSHFDGDDAKRSARLSQVWILESPGCGSGARAEGATAANEPGLRVRPASASFSMIDKEDLEERQRYLIRVYNGQARASVDELVDAVRNPKDPSIKILSLRALGRTAGPKAKATLLEALSDEESAARTVAVRSLAQGWGEEAVTPLASLLRKETEHSVIRAAVQQLGLLGTEAAWDMLQRAADSENPRVSAAARKTIRFFEDKEEGSAQGQ